MVARWWMMVSALVFVLAFAEFGLGQGRSLPSQAPDDAVLRDPVARLQARLDSGAARLKFAGPRGYLDALLAALDIPPSSQTLVFSKTSLQTPWISPDTPRAIYFNDDVYIGWVKDGPLIEIASTDPQYGTIFYSLAQEEGAPPTFEREHARCINCHLPARSEVPVPRLMVMTVVPNAEGMVAGLTASLTTDRSATASRWGGWYVTGLGPGAAHMGNLVVGGGRGPAWEADAERNTIDLADRFDTSGYLIDTSDAAALLLLTHQAEVHNLISEAAYAVRQLPGEHASLPAVEAARVDRLVRDAVEPLVRALFFVDAAPLEAGVDKSSPFARQFAAHGPRDRQGRSLRDLDLDSRLLRYPLSYLVYSEGFAELPPRARDYVSRRFREILGGEDHSQEYSHLSAAQRQTLREILQDTLPSFLARHDGSASPR